MLLTLHRLRPLKSLTFAVALLVLAGAGRAADPLRWKLEAGDDHNFRVTQKMEMSMDVPTVGPTEMAINQTMDMTWHVKEVNADGNAVVEQTVNRVQMDMDIPGGQKMQYDTASEDPPQGMAAMLAPTLKALTKGPTVMTMTPRGKIVDAKVDPELVKAMQSAPGAAMMGDMASEEGLKNMARQASIELPETLIEGEKWTSKMEIKNAMAGGAMVVETTYTYGGPKEVDGATLELIVPSVKLNFGEGAMANGTEIKVDNQETSGEILFNREIGLLESSQLKQNMSITVSTPGNAPMTQKLVQTVEMQRVEKSDLQ